MRAPFVASAAAVALLLTIGPTRAQAILDLNLDPDCRGIAQQASAPSEKGAPDLAFSQCVQSERAMQQKLVGATASASRWVEWRVIPTSSVAWKWHATRGSSIGK